MSTNEVREAFLQFYEDRAHLRTLQQAPARLFECLRIVVHTNADDLLHFRFVRCAGRESAVIEQPIPRVDEHRHRPAPRALFQRAAHELGKRRRDETRPVVG